MIETPFVSYELFLVIISVLMSLLVVATAAQRRLGWQTGACMSTLSLVLCMLCARGYYVLACNLGGFWGPVFPREPYYYAFGGGVLGFLAALWLTSRITRKPVQRLGDAFAPTGLLTIALLRLAECRSDFGWGDFVQSAWMQRYPFAIQNMYEEWCAAVFNLEALCALVLLIVVLMPALRGRRLATGLIWWAVTQIFCESLRVESIVWGFVRVQQLESALIVLAFVALGTFRLSKAQRKHTLPSWICLAAGAGLVVFLEYAIDKMPWATWINYAAMVAVLGMIGWSAQRLIPAQTSEARA